MIKIPANLNYSLPVCYAPCMPQTYIVEPWLPANQLHILGGSAGAGKTTLLVQLLSSLADRTPFLYVSSDREIGSYQTIFERIEVAPFEIVSMIDLKAEHLKTTVGIQPYPIASWAAWIENLVATRSPRPRLLICDTGLALLACRHQNDMMEVYERMTTLAAWCKVRELTTILTLHSNKVRQNDDFLNVMNRISGSHGLLGYASTKAFLVGSQKEHNDGPCLFLSGQNFKDETILLQRDSVGRFALREPNGPSQSSDEVLAAFPPPGTLITTGQLETLLAMDHMTLWRRLKVLQNARKLQRVSHGSWTRL